MTESFEEVEVFRKPALFTPIRIDRSTVPQGYYLYEVRHDDDSQGDAVEIAINILANHWGSIIVRDEIKLSPEGNLLIDPMDINYGTGDCRTLAEYMAKYPS
jgi:hypothetical protein